MSHVYFWGLLSILRTYKEKRCFWRISCALCGFLCLDSILYHSGKNALKACFPCQRLGNAFIYKPLRVFLFFVFMLFGILIFSFLICVFRFSFFFFSSYSIIGAFYFFCLCVFHVLFIFFRSFSFCSYQYYYYLSSSLLSTYNNNNIIIYNILISFVCACTHARTCMVKTW